MPTKIYGPFDSLGRFAPGDRIEVHPATDTWMRGDRYGTVEAIGRKALAVHLDRSGRRVRVSPHNIGAILS